MIVLRRPRRIILRTTTTTTIPKCWSDRFFFFFFTTSITFMIPTMMMMSPSWNKAAVVRAAILTPSTTTTTTSTTTTRMRRIMSSDAGSLFIPPPPPSLLTRRCASTRTCFLPTLATTSHTTCNACYYHCFQKSTKIKGGLISTYCRCPLIVGGPPPITRCRYNPRRKQKITCCYATTNANNDHRESIIETDSAVIATTSLVPTRMLETLGQEILPTVLTGNHHHHNNNITAIPSTTTVVLVLGVSGGCDSVALLYALEECRRQQQQQQQQKDQVVSSSSLSRSQGWTVTFPLKQIQGVVRKQHSSQIKQGEQSIQCHLHVIHFDHQQRGIDSDGDREFVQDLCTEYGIPLQIHYWNQREQQQQQQQQQQTPFSQEEARNWRRRLMRQYLDTLIQQYTETSMCESIDDSKQSVLVKGILLTAHHQDDSYETLLLKVLRGAHLTNWKGLPVTIQDKYGYTWARPLIHLRKQDLMDYLVQHNVSWREDASNLSDKYLRNRVRNELLPLLEDLCGGPDSLQRRFDYIQEQSNELRQDLDERAREYLNQSRSTHHYFVLPQNDDNKLHLVHKQALHIWVMDQIGDNFQFTYEQLQRVCQQITDYPENRQWRLNIGGNYDIQRNGGGLQLIQHFDDVPSDSFNERTTSPRRHLHYSIVDETVAVEESALDGNTNNDESLIVVIPKNLLGSSVFESTASECLAMMITPPWRESPLKVKDLLRGQKVPLEDRALVRVIMLEHPNEAGINQVHIVAVFVAHKDQWIVNKEFYSDHTANEKNDSLILCLIDL